MLQDLYVPCITAIVPAYAAHMYLHNIRTCMCMWVALIACRYHISVTSMQSMTVSSVSFHSAPKWKSTYTDVSVTSFSEYVGPSLPLGTAMKIVDLFHLFFTAALMGEIVEQTNR